MGEMWFDAGAGMVRRVGDRVRDSGRWQRTGCRAARDAGLGADAAEDWDGAALNRALQSFRRPGDEYTGWFPGAWERAQRQACTAEDAEEAMADA